MKNIKLNSIQNLKKIKKNINSIIDNRINEEEKKNSLKTISNLDFTGINNIFENLLPNLFENIKGKKYIQKYAKVIKESKALKKVFVLYEDIKKPKNINDIDLFINEAINEINNIDFSSYKSELHKLSDIIKEALINNKSDISTIVDSTIKESNTIDKAFSYLINEKKSYKNITEYTNNISLIKEYIQSNNKILLDNTSCSISDITKLSEGKSEWEKQVINDIVINNINNKTHKDLFEQYKNDCISIIDENITKCSTIEEKQKLTTLSEKISDKNYNNETFFDDIIKLSELKTLIP